jgi:hypothetical protein
MPGIILFSKIALSDAMLFLGHVQLVRTSWQTRNRIRQGDGQQYISVPVRHHGRFGQAIDETEIAGDHWPKKHLKSIYFAYKNRPHFDTYFPGLEQILNKEWKLLSDLNICIIRRVLDWLDIRTPILNSRDYPIEGHKTDMLISACRALGADQYISNPGARAYLDEAAMEQAGVRHWWQTFTHPVYEQGRPFVPDLSIVDLLFNVGPDARELVLSASSVAASLPPSLSPGAAQDHA